MRGTGNKLPGAILRESIYLKVHGFTPFGIFESSMMSGWFKCGWDGVKGGGVHKGGVKVFRIVFS